MTISTASGERQQTYDILVLATGSRANGDVPWKSSLAGYEATRDGLHKFQEQVKIAKSIVIGGAGELGNFYATDQYAIEKESKCIYWIQQYRVSQEFLEFWYL